MLAGDYRVSAQPGVVVTTWATRTTAEPIRHLGQPLRLDFRHVLSGHGRPLLDNAKMDLQRSLARSDGTPSGCDAGHRSPCV